MADVMDVLKMLESNGLLRLSKRTGNYMQVYCPIHSDGNERKPSCGVLLVDEVRNGRKYPAGFFHCFSCGFAKKLPDAISEILKGKSMSQSGLDWLKENVPSFSGYDSDFDIDYLIPTSTMQTVLSKFAVDYVISKTKQVTHYVSEEELARYRYTVPYMYERKLTDELIEKFDIGFDGNWIPEGKTKPIPCITFPVRDKNGNTLFLCRRSIKGKLFNYPKGVTKPVYGLYELPKDVKSVVICESCFNALTSWRYGRPAVALLGTGNPYQIQQLKELGVSEFILALDPDDAGMRGTEKLKNALRSSALVYEFVGIPSGKDINDLTEDEFNALDIE